MEGDIEICGLSNRYNEDVLFKKKEEPLYKIVLLKGSASVYVTFPTSSAVRKHRLRLKASWNFFFCLNCVVLGIYRRFRCVIIKILSKAIFNRVLFINCVVLFPCDIL